MMNDPRSHGLWEKTAPPAPDCTPLEGAVRADVAVVGGGYTGMSAALHLAEAGRKIVLLEATEIGFGGAGRNVGLINAGMWIMPDDLPGVLGRVHGERLLELLGNGPRVVIDLIERLGISCELQKNGTLHCAVGAAGLKEIEERVEQWQRRGAPVELLDASETARRIGSGIYAGALLDRRAGTLQPLAYVRGLAQAARSAGAELHIRSAVTGIEKIAGNWVLSTDKGSVSAPQVVVATDAYSTGPWKSVRDEQVFLPYFNFATVPLPDRLRERILPGREGCWDTKEILSSFRMDAAGRLVFGSVGALRGPAAAIHRDWARRALARIFPELGGIAFEAEWYGQIGMTDNALPRFHEFAPGIVGFSGYNGRGIAPGTVFGKTLAELVLGRITEADLPLPRSGLEPARYRPLKEAWYETGAALAHFAGARL